MKTTVRSDIFLIFLFLSVISLCLFASYFEYWFEMGESVADATKKIDYYTKAIENWRVYDGEENLALVYLKRALVYYSLNNYEKALSDLDTSIKKNKKLIDAYFYRGKIYLQNKDYERAIKDFSEVIKLDEYDEYHKSNGGVTFYLRAKAYYETNNKQPALDDLKKAFEFDKKNHEYYLLRGKIYEDLGELDIALEDYSSSILLKSDNLEGYIRRAKIYLNRNKISEALKDLSEAIKIDNKNIEVYLLRADIYIKNKNFKDAINDFSRVIELNYDKEEVRYRRGLLYFQTSDYKKAIEDFKKCLELNPQYEVYNVSYYLARSYEELKDFDNSLDYYIKASKIKSSKEIFFKIAKIYYEKESFNNSLEYLNKVLELDHKHIQALTLRSNINFLNSNYDEALKDLLSLVSLGEVSAEIYYKLGFCYYKKSNYDEAISNFTKAIELDPSGDCGSREPASAYFYRAESYYQKKDFPAALKDYTKVIQLNPNNKNAYLQRGKIYFENKLFSEAIRDLTEAINSGLKDKNTVLMRAKALYETKNYDQTIQDLKEVIDFYGEKDFEVLKMIGYCYLFTNNTSEAIEWFSKALSLKEELNLLLERAKLYYKNNIKEMAKNDLNRVLELDSKNIDALFLLSKINFEESSYEEAITYSTQLLSLGATSYPHIFYIRGISYFKISKFDEAIKDLTKATQLDPFGDCGSGVKGECFYVLGNLYELKLEKRKAIENYAKTIKINPKYKDAYLKKANLHFELFETTASLKDLNTYLTFEPNSSEALFLKGKICFEIGEYYQAEEIFKKVIEMEIPEDIKLQVCILLSKCLVYTGKYELAKEFLTNNLLINDSTLNLCLAEVYYYEGNLEAALNQLENIFLLSEKPDLKSEAYLLKIMIYLELGETQKAEFLLTEIEEFVNARIKEDPRNYRNYYILSLVYSLMKVNLEESLKLSRKSVELLTNADSYFALGLSFLVNNEVEKAIQSLRKALQINPNHIPSLYEIAKIFKNILKRPIDAETYYKKILSINPNFRFLQ